MKIQNSLSCFKFEFNFKILCKRWRTFGVPLKEEVSLWVDSVLLGLGGLLGSLSVSQSATQLFSYLLILFIIEWSSNQLKPRHALRYLATWQRSTWYLSAPQTFSPRYRPIAVGYIGDEQNYTADYFLIFLSYPNKYPIKSAPFPSFTTRTAANWKS